VEKDISQRKIHLPGLTFDLFNKYEAINVQKLEDIMLSVYSEGKKFITNNYAQYQRAISMALTSDFDIYA
jgi:hypothetical protein